VNHKKSFGNHENHEKSFGNHENYKKLFVNHEKSQEIIDFLAMISYIRNHVSRFSGSVQPLGFIVMFSQKVLTQKDAIWVVH